MRDLRIFHVSDLHFIEEWRTTDRIKHSLGEAGDLALRRAAVMKRRPYFRGAMGHDCMAVRDLEARWNDFRDGEATPDRRLFVFTGDLTAFGTEIQFRDGLAFLGGIDEEVDGAPQRRCRLNQTSWRDQRAILGNHDFFPGEPKWGRELVALWKRKPSPRGLHELKRLKLPFVSEPIKIDATSPSGRQGIDLVFLGIDTDADVWVDKEVRMRDAYFRNRMFARGDFPSQLAPQQLKELSEQMAQKAPLVPGRAQLRVLLLHHSLAYKGSRRFLEISASTQKLLRDAIDKFKVGVVLSGHIHEPKLIRMEGGFYEIRCGTTAQDQKALPRFLESWTVMRSRLREALAASSELRSTMIANFLREQKKENIYLEHTLQLADNGRLLWRVIPYIHSSRGGFRPGEGLMPGDWFAPRLAGVP